jgi:hypothetical protein
LVCRRIDAASRLKWGEKKQTARHFIASRFYLISVTNVTQMSVSRSRFAADALGERVQVVVGQLGPIGGKYSEPPHDSVTPEDEMRAAAPVELWGGHLPDDPALSRPRGWCARLGKERVARS